MSIIVTEDIVVTGVEQGLETISFVDASGLATVLADLRGITGRMMPPIRFTADTIPAQPGTRLRQVLHEARQVVIPIIVSGVSPVAHRAGLRAMAHRLDPVRGEGKLVVTAVDGTVRELHCRYVDGFGLQEDWPDFATPSLLFRADDPYWYDDADTQVDFDAGSAATFFPFFPLRLSSSEVFAAGDVTNPGDVETWPTWNVVGPGSGLVLRNLTTGKLLTLDYDLAAGESVAIDARPGYKSVERQDGLNLFGSLSDDTDLWALAVGANSVQVEMTGATGGSVVTLRYRGRRLAP